MSYRVDKQVIDTQTDGHTDAGNDNTRRPKLASGENAIWGWFQTFIVWFVVGKSLYVRHLIHFIRARMIWFNFYQVVD